jgi:nucleotide-binding universal stress UspA family protein
LYDGATPSVYAFKMFTYLMTNYAHLPLEVLCIKPMESNMHLPDNKLMKELVSRHSKEPIYTILHGLPEVEVISYLSKIKENVLVVMGAYRRTMLSRWFRSSLADAIVKELDVPLFIAHNK